MNIHVKPLNERIEGASVIQVVAVKFLRGTGTKDDVVRRVCRYYTLDGELLAEKDDCDPSPKPEIFTRENA